MTARRFSFRLTASAVAGLLAFHAFAATPQEATDCNQSKDLNRTIVACGEVIRSDTQSDTQRSQALVKRGFAYFLKREYDAAFLDFEEAIRRNPKDGAAYAYRGMIFQVRGNDDAAIADFSRVIEMGWKEEPGFPSARNNRAKAYEYRGDLALAMKDYEAEIAKNPDDFFARLNRGIAYIYEGSLDKAIVDLKHIADLNPKDPMIAIWLHIAERRAGRDSQLASKTPNFNMTRWPAPVLRLYTGEGELPFQLSERELASGLQCEADFYAAEYMMMQNRKTEAINQYKSAQKQCVRIWLEWGAATAALKSLKAGG